LVLLNGVWGYKMAKLGLFGTENRVFLFTLGDGGYCSFTSQKLSIFIAVGDECPVYP
jgi:hypothetical protein